MFSFHLQTSYFYNTSLLVSLSVLYKTKYITLYIMGQYWKLVNIDRREDLGQISSNKFPRTSLARFCNAIAASKRSSVKASLVGLPQETIDQIVELLCRDAATDDVAIKKPDPDSAAGVPLMDLLYPPAGLGSRGGTAGGRYMPRYDLQLLLPSTCTQDPGHHDSSCCAMVRPSSHHGRGLC
ncbi:hypothetical protein PG988_009449 [Apiospora saccharicola]